MRLNVNLPQSIQATPVPTTKALLESATIIAGAPGPVLNVDAIDQAVVFYTSNTTTNWALNIRGHTNTTLNNLMQIGQSLTIAVLVTNGGTAYYQTSLRIDDATTSIRWSGGTTPTSGNINSIDIYSITVIKTANATFSAFGAQTRFA